LLCVYICAYVAGDYSRGYGNAETKTGEKNFRREQVVIDRNTPRRLHEWEER